MSNHLAIATVTATLSQFLQQMATEAVPGATVTTRRPEQVEAGIPATRVNIYLYQVSPNLQMRNADLPTRQSNATLVQRPLVALDLYYLISFYGDENLLEPQRLLGKTVSAIDAQPILTPARIRDTTRTAIASDVNHYLAGSDLADQIDQVRLTPGVLTLEEFSKLWSLLSFHAPHALSMTYQASVVLIEADERPPRALPMRSAQFRAAPFNQVVIEQLRAAAGMHEPIVAGSTVIIVGQRLQGDRIQVRIGAVELTPTAAQVSDTEISLALPSGLRAGVQSVQVLHHAQSGQAQNGQAQNNTLTLGLYRAESNVLPFVLRPTITAVQAPDAAMVAVTLAPAVGRTQRVLLWLNEINPPADRPASAYTFEAPPQNGIAAAGAEETATIDFALAGVAAGDYLVRVQVDGAESPLTVDTDPNSVTFNQYSSPRVTIAA